MAWATDSTPISKRKQFRRLRDRFLFTYIGVIAATMGIFAIVTYEVVAIHRNRQLDDQLRQLSASALRLFPILNYEYGEILAESRGEVDEDDREEDPHDPIITFDAAGNPQALKLEDLIEAEGELDTSMLALGDSINELPQGIEWYRANRALIVKEGNKFPEAALPEQLPRQGKIIKRHDFHSLSLPIYDEAQQTNVGYVRVTASTAQVEAELIQLRWGLLLGALGASGLTVITGIWLTRASLSPVVQSFEQLRQFTADASHELRNPLTAIQASVAVMQNHPERIDERDEAKLEAIATASSQMRELVEDLLLLARMDHHAPNRSMWRDIPLDELLEDLVDLVRDRADQAKVQLTESFKSLTVQGDADQLKRLFLNLISNAVQYTPAGGSVAVDLEVMTNTAVVQVKDTGIGIAPEHLTKVFERFWRADPARQADAGGTGLGLAISLAIAQRHGGKITVTSEVGTGSCFEVCLPLG
ncbi:MAG: sensor histidine kinase [Spirulina sp. SIO3F2]|nr:sensor histidine kinase [Spirulina sp. SIO3F2]